jgi:hypothetical protein
MIPHKPSSIKPVGPSALLPKQFPKLPENLVRRSEGQQDWQEIDDWWYDVMSVLQADSEELRQKLNEMANEISTLKAKISALS